jgi:hypothetical protein
MAFWVFPWVLAELSAIRQFPLSPGLQWSWKREHFSLRGKSPTHLPSHLPLHSRFWADGRYSEAICVVPAMSGGLNWSVQHHLI